jgi:transcriptional regulator with XRE-family HTH domain
MRQADVMHSGVESVESNRPAVLDMRRIDLARHERIALAVRVVGGLRAAARIVEKSPATVNNWRKQGATIAVDDLAKLAGAVGVTLDWLAGLDFQTHQVGG